MYRRENEYYQLKKGLENRYTSKQDNLLPLNDNHRKHYIAIYIARNREIKEFFKLHNKDRLFYGRLEDVSIWQKMGSFFSINVANDYKVHKNATIKE